MPPRPHPGAPRAAAAGQVSVYPHPPCVLGLPHLPCVGHPDTAVLGHLVLAQQRERLPSLGPQEPSAIPELSRGDIPGHSSIPGTREEVRAPVLYLCCRAGPRSLRLL